MAFPYSARYQPPMPAVEIALGAPEADYSLGPLPAILDTGADITVVPQEYLIQLDAPIVAGGYLRSPWGERQSVKIYEVNLRIQGHALHHASRQRAGRARGVVGTQRAQLAESATGWAKRNCERVGLVARNVDPKGF